MTMTFNKKLLAATLFTVGGFAAISSANAADKTATNTFDVSMTVDTKCNVTTGNNISLATIDASGEAPAVASATFNIACSKGTPYNISMLPSGASSAGIGAMKSATASEVDGNTDTIAYQLTSDLAGDTIWTDLQGGNGGGLAINNEHTVYAKVTTEDFKAVRPDIYTEEVTVSVAY